MSSIGIKQLEMITGNKNLGNVMSSIFEQVMIVEEEIKAYRSRPNIDELHKQAIFNSFEIFAPNCSLCNWRLIPNLLHYHVREILDRILANEDINPPTNAEVLWVLSEMSMRQPLNADATYLMSTIFRKVFGEENYKKCFDEHQPSESYEGASDDILYSIKRRLSGLNRHKAIVELRHRYEG